jgi:hypothetical protein
MLAPAWPAATRCLTARSSLKGPPALVHYARTMVVPPVALPRVAMLSGILHVPEASWTADANTRCCRRPACLRAAACASATRREAGNRVERGFRGESRQRVFVAGMTTGVLSHVMDAASNELLLAARAEGQRAETDFRRAAPAAAPRHDGRRRGMLASRLKPAPTNRIEKPRGP